ncbi:MAG: DUF882 domain-containing protein [Gammaproteobacteria bacterium]|nr:DUF882 domain-containing protein [Gammaproteobacteria bacterium]
MNDVGRRRFLTAAMTVSGGLAMSTSPQLLAAPSKERRLFLKNMHTGESLDVMYWKNGIYIPESTEAISQILRDHRRNEQHDIDPSLLDLLHNLHAAVEAPFGIEIFSGYRSPETNQALRENNKGVAKKSLHMVGKAVDIRIPRIKLGNVRKAALALQSGGVGYYSKSGFIHVDTGPVRQWSGKS